MNHKEDITCIVILACVIALGLISVSDSISNWEVVVGRNQSATAGTIRGVSRNYLRGSCGDARRSHRRRFLVQGQCRDDDDDEDFDGDDDVEDSPYEVSSDPNG